MRAILQESNADLFNEVERLIDALNETQVVPELVFYHRHVTRACAELRVQIRRNIHYLALGEDGLLPEILSETQRLASHLQLYNQRVVGPVLRGLPSDRLSLHIIGWLHAAHPETTSIPAAVSTEEFSIWPDPPHPVIYFMPVSAQHGLLYQPLFFHEFGHLLYACHEPKMSVLVHRLQIRLAKFLGVLEPLPDEAPNDELQERQRRERIILIWYKWTQELFCDAVGLTIGGPAYVHAFNRYLRVSPRTEYSCPPDELAHRAHPVTWLRARLLARRGRRSDNPEIVDTAATMDRQWEQIATTMGIEENYHGFCEKEFLPMIEKTVDRMLEETTPYPFTGMDTDAEEWTPSASPVELLNLAWRKNRQDPVRYPAWERAAVNDFLTTPAAEPVGQ